MGDDMKSDTFSRVLSTIMAAGIVGLLSFAWSGGERLVRIESQFQSLSVSVENLLSSWEVERREAQARDISAARERAILEQQVKELQKCCKDRTAKWDAHQHSTSTGQ